MKRPNGSGTVFYRKDKKRYCACVQTYDPYRRQMCRFFERKKDALAALPALREELLHQGIKKEAPTIRSLWEEWSTTAMEKLSGSKQTAYKIAYKRLSAIERAFIADVQTRHLQAVLEGLSYYQAKDVKNLLSHLYKLAMANQAVTVNLSSFMQLPELEEKEAEPFSEDEVRKMWEAFGNGDTFAGQILLMVYTGMMPGELIGAKKEQIDWEHQRIVGAGLKTKERKDRSIMLPDAIIPVLHAVCDSHRFGSVCGVNKDRWYDLYHEATNRIGIRDLPPYACRHTTATALALGDSNPLLITRIMRQARPMTTERYKHADEGKVLNELNKLTVTYQK